MGKTDRKKTLEKRGRGQKRQGKKRKKRKVESGVATGNYRDRAKKGTKFRMNTPVDLSVYLSMSVEVPSIFFKATRCVNHRNPKWPTSIIIK